jgi:hypothetical protein
LPASFNDESLKGRALIEEACKYKPDGTIMPLALPGAPWS